MASGGGKCISRSKRKYGIGYEKTTKISTRGYENSGLTKRDYGAMQAIKPYMLPTHKSWFA